MVREFRYRDWLLRGQNEGHRFLLICIDVWDATKGAKDGGYYPVFANTCDEVRAELDARQGPDWSGTKLSDACEGVIDLTASDQNPETRVFAPDEWREKYTTGGPLN